MPRLGAGLDRLNWKITKQMILEVFRNKPIRITVYTPFRSRRSGSEAKTGYQSESSAEIAKGKDAASCESSRDDDQAIPYGLEERLAGHDTC